MNTKDQEAELYRTMAGNDKCSKWEADFLESVAEQLEAGRDLSERQMEKIKQIQLKG